MTPTARPNLFLVGAPRCGTTALMSYLGAHQDIFVAKQKEAHHFGSDVHVRNGFEDRNAYLELFSSAAQEKHVGESSVFYLRSEHAAEEIAAFNPEARILVMLRDPVAMIYSMHSRMYVSGHEDIASFKEALNTEEARAKGEHLPPSTIFPSLCFQYRQLGLYADQLRRYLGAFPSEQVFVGLYDDLAEQPAKLYANVLSFLEVPHDGRTAFPKVNPAVSSRVGQQVANAVYRPPPFFRKLYNAIPSPLKGHGLGSKLASAMSTPRTAPHIQQDLERSLRAYFARSTEELSVLINRDLSHWLTGQVSRQT